MYNCKIYSVLAKEHNDSFYIESINGVDPRFFPESIIRLAEARMIKSSKLKASDDNDPFNKAYEF